MEVDYHNNEQLFSRFTRKAGRRSQHDEKRKNNYKTNEHSYMRYKKNRVDYK